MIPASSAAPPGWPTAAPQEDLILATVIEPTDTSTSLFSTGRGKLA